MEDRADPSMSPAYTVLFDEDCEWCVRNVSVWARWDRAGLLETVPAGTPGLGDRFPRVRVAACRESLHVVGRDGRVWIGAAAVERVLQVLPGIRASSEPREPRLFRRIAERAFHALALKRYGFSCSRHCPTRGPDASPPLAASRPREDSSIHEIRGGSGIPSGKSGSREETAGPEENPGSRRFS